MTAIYRIDVMDVAGTARIHTITEFQSLNYTKKRNAPGECTFTLNGNSPKIPDILVDDRQIQVWRKNDRLGLGWTKDFEGFIRSYEFEDSFSSLATFSAPGALSLLADRVIAYPVDVTNRSLFTNIPVETIIHTLVNYNAGPGATLGSNRIRAGVDERILMGTNDERGVLVSSWECSEDNLLDTIQQVANKYGFAFDLIRTSEAENTFLFRIIAPNDLEYDNRIHVFSKERGNLGLVRYTYNRVNERTVGITGGKLTNNQKAYTVVASHKGGNREVFISASNADTDNERTKEADVELKSLEAKPQLEVEVIQSPSSYYGIHYKMNDFVTALYRGTSYTYYIDQVTVSFDAQNGERIDVRLAADLELTENTGV